MGYQKDMGAWRVSSIFIKFFGNGLGATIDLSNTLDSAIKNSHHDLKSVRIIHLGFFYILYKFGILGLLLYLLKQQ